MGSVKPGHGALAGVTVVSSIDVAEQFALTASTESDRDACLALVHSLRCGVIGDPLKSLKKMHPDEFCSGDSFKWWHQFRALVSKVPYKKTDVDREKTAVDAWFAAERRCKRANRRMRHYRRFPNREPELMRVLLSRAKSEIRKLIGDLTEVKLSKILEKARPGKGVTIGTQNRFRTSTVYKWVASDWTCYESSLPWAASLLRGVNSDLVGERVIDVVSCARTAFVPKSGLTYRSIAVEANLPMMLQLGVHEYFRERLQKVGIDITNQSVNQQLALLGSRGGFDPFSTVDLSSASDSVCHELVRRLMPPSWFMFLDDIRSKKTDVDGREVLLEKFSSMGNGVTFALETMIFWALSRACVGMVDCNQVISVYGDDIIIPQSATLLLFEVLAHCGFVVNSSKTYVVGSFRESCGADWFSGNWVTPVYLQTEDLLAQDVNRLTNSEQVSSLRPWLITRLRRKNCLVQGLENEVAESCVFIPYEEAVKKSLIRYNPFFQSPTFLGLTEVAVKDRWIPPEWRLIAATLGQHQVPALRDLTTVRMKRMTPGSRSLGWRDKLLHVA